MCHNFVSQTNKFWWKYDGKCLRNLLIIFLEIFFFNRMIRGNKFFYFILMALGKNPLLSSFGFWAEFSSLHLQDWGPYFLDCCPSGLLSVPRRLSASPEPAVENLPHITSPHTRNLLFPLSRSRFQGFMLIRPGPPRQPPCLKGTVSYNITWSWE